MVKDQTQDMGYAGQERGLEPLQQPITGSQGIMLVYDITNEKSLITSRTGSGILAGARQR